MLAKVWSMAGVVLLAASVSLTVVIQGALRVPIEGSIALFLVGTTLHLFATTAMGIFMATVAQHAAVWPAADADHDAAGNALRRHDPRESMPAGVRTLMSLAPTTHFTELSQAILYRGAGLEVVWTSFVALFLIGAVLFALSLARFRKAIAQMA